MESPRIVAVKSEVENIEYEDSKSFDFEFHVKVENLQTQVLHGDWCIENQLLYSCDKDPFGESTDDQLFKQECVRCSHIFEDSHALCTHNLTHLEIRLVDIKHNFIEKTKENEELYVCDICDKIIPYRLRFIHRKKHKDDVFTCSVCNASFEHRRYLTRHIRYVHSPTLIPKHDNPDATCDLCSAEFKNKMLLSLHMKNCHSDSAICHICNSKLKSKSYLLTHLRRVHYNDGKEHRCDLCNKNFRSPRYLSIHKKNSHLKSTKKCISKVKKTEQLLSISENETETKDHQT